MFSPTEHYEPFTFFVKFCTLKNSDSMPFFALKAPQLWSDVVYLTVKPIVIQQGIFTVTFF